MLFVSTSTAFHELSLISIAKSFAKIQYQRLVIPAKACLFLLAGFAVAQLVTWVQAWRQTRDAERADEAVDKTKAEPNDEPKSDASIVRAKERGQRPRRALERQRPISLRAALLAGLVCLILSPFVRPALEQLGSTYLRTIGGLVLKSSIHYWGDYQRFLTWSAHKHADEQDLLPHLLRAGPPQPPDDGGAGLQPDPLLQGRVHASQALQARHRDHRGSALPRAVGDVRRQSTSAESRPGWAGDPLRRASGSTASAATAPSATP